MENNNSDCVEYTLTLKKNLKTKEDVIELESPLSIYTIVLYDTIKNEKWMEEDLIYKLCEKIKEYANVRWEK